MTERKLKSFTAPSARPLPVVILADTSGSMGEAGKIDALNTALKEMIESFAQESEGQAEIHIAVVTFGGEAKIHQELTAAHKFSFLPLGSHGSTPMGAAFDLARTMIEDKDRVPSRAYTPSIVLVSDGQPQESPAGYWKQALSALLKSDRATKAQRFALGIGQDADVEVLRAFIGNESGKVYGASDARQIRSFFKWVTMSITSRSRSATPNSASVDAFAPSDLDELL